MEVKLHVFTKAAVEKKLRSIFWVGRGWGTKTKTISVMD